MENKGLMTIIGIVVGVILAGSLLVPVIQDATDHTKTFDNREVAISYVDKDSEVLTITGNGNTLYVNGVAIPLLNASFTTIQADTFAIRSSGGTLHFNVFAPNSVLDYTGEINLIADSGTITGTVGANTINKSYEYIYYTTNQDADYIMTNALGAYVHKSDVIHCIAYNAVLATGSANRWYYVEGSIESGFTAVNVAGASFEVSDMEYSEVPDYDDLYNIKSVTFAVGDGQLVIDRFIAPAETVSIQDHNPGIDAVYLAIPIIVIVALIVFAIPMVRRDD